MERQGLWGEASTRYEKILERAPNDSYTHLALARLEARRERSLPIPSSLSSSSSSNDDTNTTSVMANGKTAVLAAPIPTKAQTRFETGTAACPNNVHLWQAWAVYEESRGHSGRARELFEEALTLDPQNPYVCHAFGLMEKKLGNSTKATDLYQRALKNDSTAALVCSLGEILIANRDLKQARDLYARHLLRMKTEKDRIEVYLASAWLEERYFQSYDRAKELLNSALALSPGSSLANVALARLEGRMNRRGNKRDKTGDKATAKRLADACKAIEKGKQLPSDPTDGRVFNALATLEVKSRRYSVAREVLKRGMKMFPLDHTVSFSLCFNKARYCCVWIWNSPL
jgi:tetratricopeptide (TPR) repeat protein